MPGGRTKRIPVSTGTTADSSPPKAPVQKPPPDLPLFYMLSHLEEDGPVRLDG